MVMVTAAKHESTRKQIEDLAVLRPLTADDLRTLPDDGNRYEIIGGELYVSPSPTFFHQRVSFKLTSALDAYLTSTSAGQAVAAPMDVHLSANDVVQPDLLVVLNDNKQIIHKHGIVGPPDLVIEILSPSSMETDFLRKSKLYERSGVREYWIVNPEGATVSVQTLEGDRYVLTGEFSREATLRSKVLDDYELKLATIFPTPSDESDLAKESASINDE
jgi:Uma2 family endonuclease